MMFVVSKKWGPGRYDCFKKEKKMEEKVTKT